MRRMPIRGRKNPLRAVTLRLESLEGRLLLSSDALRAGYAVPGPIFRPLTPAQVAMVPSGYTLDVPSATPRGTAGPAAQVTYTPAQIRHAYGVDQLSGDGTGQTIAIVDAYDETAATVASDLAAFDKQFGLPAAKLTVATPQGTPQLNQGWDVEISLDVQWAHAIAPGATILLVEAATASDANLLDGVTYAVNQGANQVSMSWGQGEFTNQSSADGYFQHDGVTFLAASGDAGGVVNFPSVSPYVTSVGGTTLALDSSNNKLTESAWSSGGGGASTMNPEPPYQRGFFASAYRGTPDVAYDADLNSGFYVYLRGGFGGVGGTSAGTPQWAALIALANQGRKAAGEAPLGSGLAYGTNTVLYQLAGGTSYTNPNGDYYDVTTGSNGYPATKGYDLATGLGSPVANKLVPDLIGQAPATVPTVGDSGFEAVPVGAGNFAYDPSGSAWAFAGYAGVSGNGSGFTAGNPNAPQGTQVAFLQEAGSIAQTVPGWAAGTYAISFQAAQRGNYGAQQEDFEVLVDGNVVGTFKPTSASYQPLTTAAFTVSAGSHVVKFVGLNSAGGDNTALIDSVAVAVAVAASNVPTVGDSGFEAVPVGGGNFAYDPSGSAWAFAGYAGVSGNGSGFTAGNPAAPQGAQVAFLQEAGSIAQTVPGWAAGTYAISFQAAQRGNYGAQQEDFEVLVDGNVVGTFKPTGPSYQPLTTAAFTVTAGSHVVKFVGLNSAGGDNTALIDSVAVAVAVAASNVPTVGDSGFEAVAVGGGNFAYDPSGSAWAFAGYAGVSGNGSGFTVANPAAPQGTQVAFLQETGSITQSVAGWAAGSYTISFASAQRGNDGVQQEDFEVLVDGNVVGTFKPTSASYQPLTTATFTVSAGSHVVEFLGLNSAGGDNTALIDAVTVARTM